MILSSFNLAVGFQLSSLIFVIAKREEIFGVEEGLGLDYIDGCFVGLRLTIFRFVVGVGPTDHQGLASASKIIEAWCGFV